MAESKKPQFEKITTPICTAKYPRVNQPDTKFDAAGVYSIKGILEAEAGTPLKAKLQAAAEKALEEAKATLTKKINEEKGEKKAKAKKALEELELSDLPCQPEYDDDGEETGRLVFNFKMKAQRPDPKDKDRIIKMSPKLFDAKGNTMSANVWGGSKVRIAGQIVPFYNAAKHAAGVSLRLSAVQVIELVTGSGGTDPKAYGFGEEEGYDASGEKAAASEETAAAPQAAGSSEGGASAASDDEF
jgi:hypothetical protein